ncbi:MAG: hypothetical protein WBO28_08885 [Flavobacteriales bacterium]|jgi:hypothetical protein
MKKLAVSLLTLLFSVPMWACEVCEKQQPAVLKGISHGTGPQSGWDMPIIYVSALIVLVTLIYAVKFLVKPGEGAEDHIKRSILNTPLHDGN